MPARDVIGRSIFKALTPEGAEALRQAVRERQQLLTLPTWGHSRSWGYGPSGGIGLVVLILVILLLMGRI